VQRVAFPSSRQIDNNPERGFERLVEAHETGGKKG